MVKRLEDLQHPSPNGHQGHQNRSTSDHSADVCSVWEDGLSSGFQGWHDERDPDWFYNVLAHPDVTVEVGNEQFEATARILRGAEREKAFEKAMEFFPPYGSYQKKTSREIPIIALERSTREPRT